MPSIFSRALELDVTTGKGEGGVNFWTVARAFLIKSKMIRLRSQGAFKVKISIFDFDKKEEETELIRYSKLFLIGFEDCVCLLGDIAF